MITIKDRYNTQINQIDTQILSKDSCFIDIETTGFSRDRCIIYMIGLAKVMDILPLDDDSYEYEFEITLLFAEDLDSEEELLQEFLTYSGGMSSFITFNGVSFDFPFIQARMDKYNISYDYTIYNQIDIFKLCKNLKSLLKLSNLKQKTIEAFLGISRNDKYSGGELIEQYMSYTKTHDEILYNNLITHNLEDVRGMIDLIIILRYTNIYSLINTDCINDITVNDSDNTISANLSLICPLPRRVTVNSPYYYIIFEGVNVKVLLKPKACKMKYYLSNYKNYYYLKTEDIIIPKQLLNSSNKKDAVKASKEKCFVEKAGLFMPVYDIKLFENDKLYRENYNDKLFFADISEVIDDTIYIKNYILHIIKNEVE